MNFQTPSGADARVAQAIAALRRCRPVLVRDDAEREEEADLIAAAELIDVPVMTQLIRDCSGIVCLGLDAAQVAQLGLRRMVERNESRHGTPFTVSNDAREGITIGVSAADRVTTVRAATQPDAGPQYIVSPGHVFPLYAAPDAVLARRGHAEAAVDLMRLAGLRPAAMLCELMNSDGSMARGDQLMAYARQSDLVLLSEDVIEVRRALQTELAAQLVGRCARWPRRRHVSRRAAERFAGLEFSCAPKAVRAQG